MFWAHTRCVAQAQSTGVEVRILCTVLHSLKQSSVCCSGNPQQSSGQAMLRGPDLKQNEVKRYANSPFHSLPDGQVRRRLLLREIREEIFKFYSSNMTSHQNNIFTSDFLLGTKTKIINTHRISREKRNPIHSFSVIYIKTNFRTCRLVLSGRYRVIYFSSSLAIPPVSWKPTARETYLDTYTIHL